MMAFPILLFISQFNAECNLSVEIKSKICINGHQPLNWECYGADMNLIFCQYILLKFLMNEEERRILKKR